MNRGALDAAHGRIPDLDHRLARTQSMLRRQQAFVRRTGRPAHPLASASERDPFAQLDAFEDALHELERARGAVATA